MKVTNQSSKSGRHRRNLLRRVLRVTGVFALAASAVILIAEDALARGLAAGAGAGAGQGNRSGATQPANRGTPNTQRTQPPKNLPPAPPQESQRKGETVEQKTTEQAQNAWANPWYDATGPIRLRLLSGAPGGQQGPVDPSGVGPLRLNHSLSTRSAYGPPASPPRGERALRAVENVRVRRLMTELKANQEQRRVIREAYSEGLQKKHELLRERAELLIRMREMVGSDKAAGVHEREREMNQLLFRYRRVERELAEATWATEDRIFVQLPLREKVRYILLNEGFDRELAERIGALRQRSRGTVAPVPSAEMPE